MPLPPHPALPTDQPPSGKAGGTYAQKDIGRTARSTDAMTTRAGGGPSAAASDKPAPKRPKA